MINTESPKTIFEAFSLLRKQNMYILSISLIFNVLIFSIFWFLVYPNQKIVRADEISVKSLDRVESCLMGIKNLSKQENWVKVFTKKMINSLKKEKVRVNYDYIKASYIDSKGKCRVVIKDSEGYRSFLVDTVRHNDNGLRYRVDSISEIQNERSVSL